jgi:hypothetical protein
MRYLVQYEVEAKDAEGAFVESQMHTEVALKVVELEGQKRSFQMDGEGNFVEVK